MLQSRMSMDQQTAMPDDPVKSVSAESGSDVDWALIRPGQQYSFHYDANAPITGVVDACTEDRSVIWVRMNDGGGRRLIHIEDGYRPQRAG